MTLFRGKRRTLPKLELTEAERRVLLHGVTPGCPVCEEAVESLKQKGFRVSENWQGVHLV